MIALIALIAAVVVIGGGIEVLRRARFGVGPSAAHHRALDTLGHITTSSADSGSDLVRSEEPAVLSHVRKAVESDRAQPRIEPQPVSRPVAVPAITGGPNFVGTIPAGQPLGRGPETEIEGVRLLRPDPDPDDLPVADELGGPDVDDREHPDATGQMALPLAGDDESAEWQPDGDAGWPPEDPEGTGHERRGATALAVDVETEDEAGAAAQPATEVGVGDEGVGESAWVPEPVGWDEEFHSGEVWPSEDAGSEHHDPGSLGAVPAAPAAADGPGQDPGPPSGHDPVAGGEPSEAGVAGWGSVLHAGVGSLGGAVWDDHATEAPASWYDEAPGFDPVDETGWAHDDQAATPVPQPSPSPADLPTAAVPAIGTSAAERVSAADTADVCHHDDPPDAADRAVRLDDLADTAERVLRIDDLDDDPEVGPPTQPVGRVAGAPEPDAQPVGRVAGAAEPEAQPVGRVIRIDDLSSDDWAGDAHPYADALAGRSRHAEQGRTVRPTSRAGGPSRGGRWDKGSSGATPDARDAAGAADVEAGSDELSGAQETATGEHPIVMRFDDLGAPAASAARDVPELRPHHISAGPGGQSGAIPGLTPDETRAQLAALAQSGGMGAVPGTARRRHRRTRGGDRRHRLTSAAMLLAAVVIFGGAVYLVASGSSGGHPHRPRTAGRPPAASFPGPSTTAPSASLVSQSSTTATYQVTGSPTIALTFNSMCWTQVRQGSASGPLLFEGTESAGTTKQLTGPVWVRLGNPTAVSVTVGGTTVAQPSVAAGTPFNLQFQ